jgi:GNAT superfamily N-acetyltransferase
MSLIFKKATEKDIPVIAALADRIWRKHYMSIIGLEQIEYVMKTTYSPESILQQMKDMQNYTLVYNNEMPIGYISISTKDHKHYFLHKFYVEVAEQGKGIGTELFQYIFSTLETLQTIELTVNRFNYKAINFYFKMGFVIKEVADFDIGNGFFMNDFVMIRRVKTNEANQKMK